jgi:hypothetical protein
MSNKVYYVNENINNIDEINQMLSHLDFQYDHIIFLFFIVNRTAQKPINIPLGVKKVIDLTYEGKKDFFKMPFGCVYQNKNSSRSLITIMKNEHYKLNKIFEDYKPRAYKFTNYIGNRRHIVKYNDEYYLTE